MRTHIVPEIWTALQAEAKELHSSEPLIHSCLNLVLDKSSWAETLVAVLTARLGDDMLRPEELHELLHKEFMAKPSLLENAARDLKAVVERDAACTRHLEPLLLFKGFQAIQVYRVAHSLWNQDRHFVALMLQSIVSRKLSVDIHPAAQIGYGILMDHGTNVVIGETSIVGNNVSILHGVSLGGTGKERGDRHPKIGDGVMIGAHAQLLGNIRVGKGAKIGAGAVVLENVPPHTTVAGVPASLVGRCKVSMPALAMDQDFRLRDESDPLNVAE